MKNTTLIGRRAEAAAASALRAAGYVILAKNWKTPTCEIDIIAKKEQAIFFVEVKYRSRISQGDGFDYITAAKQRRMRYGAKLWAAKNNWKGACSLMAASVIGPRLAVDIIELIY